MLVVLEFIYVVCVLKEIEMVFKIIGVRISYLGV